MGHMVSAVYAGAAKVHTVFVRSADRQTGPIESSSGRQAATENNHFFYLFFVLKNDIFFFHIMPSTLILMHDIDPLRSAILIFEKNSVDPDPIWP